MNISFYYLKFWFVLNRSCEDNAFCTHSLKTITSTSLQGMNTVIVLSYRPGTLGRVKEKRESTPKQEWRERKTSPLELIVSFMAQYSVQPSEEAGCVNGWDCFWLLKSNDHFNVVLGLEQHGYVDGRRDWRRRWSKNRETRIEADFIRRASLL